MGFAYEYTFHDLEYIIRTMNTKHEGCTYTVICLEVTLHTVFVKTSALWVVVAAVQLNHSWSEALQTINSKKLGNKVGMIA